MTYELALKLKNAGFKSEHQMDSYTSSFCELCPYVEEYQPSYGGVEANKGFIEMCYPTISELIEACGEEFCTLQTKITDNPNEKYRAGTFDGVGVCYGSTPEEAVAKLWLAINKK